MDKQPSGKLEDRINERIELSSFGKFIVRKVLDIKNWPISHKFYNKLYESLQKEKIELDKWTKHNFRYKFKRLFRELEPQLTKFKQNKLDYSIDVLEITLKEKGGLGGDSPYHWWTPFPEQTPIPEGCHVFGSAKNPRYENEITQFYEECARLGFQKPDPGKYNHSTIRGTGHYIDGRWPRDISNWGIQITKLGLIRPSDKALVCIKVLPKSPVENIGREINLKSEGY